MKMFENRVLRQIFGRQRQKVTGHWRILHNEELHDSKLLTKYYSSDHIKRMRSTRHGARMGDRRYVYRVLVGKPEGETNLKT
jgi:hypothetical protein